MMRWTIGGLTLRVSGEASLTLFRLVLALFDFLLANELDWDSDLFFKNSFGKGCLLSKETRLEGSSLRLTRKHEEKQEVCCLT